MHMPEEELHAVLSGIKVPFIDSPVINAMQSSSLHMPGHFCIMVSETIRAVTLARL